MGRLKPLPFRVIKRRLEAAGFAEVTQSGSHVKFARISQERVATAIVPRKSEVPVGTIRSILKIRRILIRTNGKRLGDLGAVELAS